MKDVALAAIEGFREDEESDTSWELGWHFYRLVQDS
jgi:nucleoside 2-deoxyribosyltransferase